MDEGFGGRCWGVDKQGSSAWWRTESEMEGIKLKKTDMGVLEWDMWVRRESDTGFK